MSDLVLLEQQLKSGFEQLGLMIDTAPFVAYLQLLNQWNRAYNLTAVRDISAMASRHIIDSLAILPWMRGHHWLDVGTGPGLPGIPLALACPDAKITLLDSNGKKIRFLREVVRTLSLSHVEVVESRVEAYHPACRFDTVVSRAFSAMKPMIENTHHLIDSQGLWLAMKGQVPSNELEALKKIDTLNQSYQIKKYTVPNISGARCCILIESSS
ncbi:MAG: 16S rRNA (guanine(527)-N(7))-methyltransferase RsmG [Gammaproteobacteria bacterium]|nr:16S rRNA (guanine(527)-N(7))-methyltransferase RsmG [Gammaproteobacteria bacterium]MCH9764242.1 16S rRNA (guanine(527)-N(7))-methyltransferase RsmG [Gammaproteobacteria bacterium]